MEYTSSKLSNYPKIFKCFVELAKRLFTNVVQQKFPCMAKMKIFLLNLRGSAGVPGRLPGEEVLEQWQVLAWHTNGACKGVLHDSVPGHRARGRVVVHIGRQHQAKVPGAPDGWREVISCSLNHNHGPMIASPHFDLNSYNKQLQ